MIWQLLFLLTVLKPVNNVKKCPSNMKMSFWWASDAGSEFSCRARQQTAAAGGGWSVQGHQKHRLSRSGKSVFAVFIRRSGVSGGE